MLVDDEPLVAKLFGHRRARIRRRVLDIRPVDVLTGKRKIRFDRFDGIIWAPENQPAYDEHLIAVQVVDGFERGIPNLFSMFALRVFRRGIEEGKVAFEDVLDAEKHVSKAGLPHKRRERVSVICDGRRHTLDEIIQVVEAGIDDGSAQLLEAPNIERDVVVYQKNGFRTVVACVAYVGQNPVE